MTTFLYEIRDPHSRVNDERASACAFDLLMLNGDDLRHKPYVERKAGIAKTSAARSRHSVRGARGRPRR
jgi:ATP-dependent DNA ligase